MDHITCFVNGQKQEHVSVLNRGLHYGDGLFETIQLTEGALELWPAHYRRLRAGCERMGLQAPNADLLFEEMKWLTSKQTSAVIKVILTAEPGGRGYVRNGVACQRILLLYTPKKIPCPEKGITLFTCQTRLGRNSALAGIKHLNRLEQVIARRELPPTCQEGLMLDEHDLVIEGIMSNVFCVKGTQLLTPKIEFSGVAGVLRATLIDLAKRLNLDVQETTLFKSDLLESDELFVCNSLIRIWPVRRWESRQDFAQVLTQKLIKACTLYIKEEAILLA